MTRQRVFLVSLLLLHIIPIKPPGLCLPSPVPTAPTVASATLNDLLSSVWVSSSVSIRILLPLLGSQLRQGELPQREHPVPCPSLLVCAQGWGHGSASKAFPKGSPCLPESVAIPSTSFLWFPFFNLFFLCCSSQFL